MTVNVYCIEGYEIANRTYENVSEIEEVQNDFNDEMIIRIIGKQNSASIMKSYIKRIEIV